MTKLLHPELIEGIPIYGRKIAASLDGLAQNTFYDYFKGNGQTSFAEPGVSVVIRALNEAQKLDCLFDDLDRQAYRGDKEVIVVDNESHDQTKRVARKHGAEVIDLPRHRFTYPRSANLGVEAASHDLVFLTVGHVALSNTQLIRAGARRFQIGNSQNKVGGVYSVALPNYNASLVEKLSHMTKEQFFRKSGSIETVGMGVLSTAGAMISKAVWKELGGFNERYESGGEGTVMASKMIKAGFRVIRDPRLAVHHSHGLGLINYWRQWSHSAMTFEQPVPLNMDELIARRPDLRLT